jgi:type IV secretory pathway TrbD component
VCAAWLNPLKLLHLWQVPVFEYEQRNLILNQLVRSVFGLILRVGLLVAGLVFFLSLMVAASLLLMVWLLRSLWARLTGQPVTPWAFNVNREAMRNRFYRQPGQGPMSRPGSGSSPKREDTDVIDVEPKEIKPPST